MKISVIEARRIIAAQAATAPPKNAGGKIDLSPRGSLTRAAGVVDVNGCCLHLDEQEPSGFPSQSEAR